MKKGKQKAGKTIIIVKHKGKPDEVRVLKGKEAEAVAKSVSMTDIEKPIEAEPLEAEPLEAEPTKKADKKGKAEAETVEQPDFKELAKELRGQRKVSGKGLRITPKIPRIS